MNSVMAWDDEAALLDRAKAGDQLAFVRLVRSVEPGMRAAVRRVLRERDEVEDIVQEAVLRAYRGLAAFRGESSVRTWLQRIAVNASLDELRRRRPQESLDDDERPEVADARPDQFELASTRHDVIVAMATLPADQRDVVRLVDLEGLDYATVARRLGIPKGTVASRLHRAHASLRIILGGSERVAA